MSETGLGPGLSDFTSWAWGGEDGGHANEQETH